MQSCLIADDHALVRDALSISVAARWPQAAVWEATDYPSAWAQAEQQPDLCLVDLSMPGSAPREGVAHLMRIAPAAHVMVITGLDDDDLMLALLGDGVAGFISKSANSAVITAAIGLVLAGGRFVPPRVAQLAVRAGMVEAKTERLSSRQVEVLRLIGDGETNKEIARTLAISPATVKVHIAQAMSALGAANRTDAAMKARDLGVI